MKNKTLLRLCLSLWLATPVFGATFTWNNAANDNDFANLGNWSGGPISFEMGTDNWDVNLLGDDRAVLSSSLRVQRDVRIGDENGQGELLITTGGHLTVTRNFRTARGGDSVTGLGIVTVDGGGQLTSENDLYFGQSLNPGNTFTLIDGLVTAARDLAVAHQAGTYSTVNVLGGELIASRRARFSDGGNDESTTFFNISGSGKLIVKGVENEDGIFVGGDISFAHNDGVATSHVTVSDNALVSANQNVNFGEGVQSESSLTMTSGTIFAGASSRIGFGISSQVTVDITGGSYEARNGFIGFGQGPGAEVTVTMSGGEIAADRMGFANSETATALLNMTGGRIVLARTLGTASHSGGLRMQSPGAELNFGGSAEVHAEKLYIEDGGLLTLGGNASISISGSSDGDNPTFDFARSYARGDWSPVLGRIVLNGGTLVVSGATNTFQLSDGAEEPNFTETTVNYAELLNAAIAQGIVYTSVTEGNLEVRYDAGADTTELALVLPLEPPSSPSGLAVAPDSADSLSVSWDASTGEVDGYRVERRGGGASDWAHVTETPNLGVLDTGLAADTIYEYRLQAFNTAGASDWSSTATGRTLTLEPPVFTIPNKWVSDPELGLIYGYTSSNWAYSLLIGFMEFSSFPWIYQAPHGWAYSAGRSVDGSVIILYFYEELGWAYASEDFPGQLYRVETAEFIDLF